MVAGAALPLPSMSAEFVLKPVAAGFKEPKGTLFESADIRTEVAKQVLSRVRC